MARLNDMVIIIKRSDNAESGRRPRVTLACERSGTFYGHWELKVVRGTHNHPIGQYLEGHSFAGCLTPAQDAFVLNLSKVNSQPIQILNALKNEWTNTKATLSHIYNARLKHRVVVLVERKGQSQMQYLMTKLKDERYFYHHRRCEKINVVKDIFFAHHTSVELLHAFPFFLFMDCTYKINIYKLPLFEIVGVTSTGMTFAVAFAYLESEQEDNYMWACNILKDLMHGDCLPTVILTDRELALVNVVESAFPTATHLLCKWHIQKNVLAKCKKAEYFPSDAKWKSFSRSFDDVIDAENECDFVDFLIRVESNYVKLKRCLRTRRGNFETCWSKIHSLLETSHIVIKASFEKSINVVQHKFKLDVFMMLRVEISINELNMILKEMESRSCDDHLLCGCILRKTCGFPCSHEINEFKVTRTPISLDIIDRFWKKLDMKAMQAS
ncbi:hypothetical protein ACS0TY_026318 [Phlomoides rotata]